MTNIRAQYAKNAATFRAMLKRAEASPRRRCNGYTVAALRDSVSIYERLSRASDEELTAHFEKARRLAAIRLAELRAADCEKHGHAWVNDGADTENGTEDIHCTRCGASHHFQF